MNRDFFQPGGALNGALADYEDRAEQHLMATAVGEAMEQGHGLLVEAGTGTGKSLAYLVPSIMSGLRVVVSTGTRSLQDQLLSKDLPVLKDIVDKPFTAVPLKGTGNYLCRRKLEARLALGDESEEWSLVEDWASTTEVGDRAELAEIPENAPIWAQVTTTPEARLGPRCPHYEKCFVTRARRKAEHADLVVVNHHLFFADLALRKEHPGARVLPEYQAVVFDEAHQLEEVMTEHFGVDVSSTRVEHLVRDWRNHVARSPHSAADLWMPNRGKQRSDQVAQCSLSFFAQLRRRLAGVAQASGGERFTLPDDLVDEEIREQWLALDTALEELYAHGLHGSECLRDDEHLEQAEEMKILAQRCARFRDDLAAIADRQVGRGEYVYWGRLRGMAVSMHASPVGVEAVLGEKVVSEVHSVVLTSATLSAGGKFSHIRERLGLGPESVEELRVESPFDYQQQCLLYLPRDIPDPRNPDDAAERQARVAQLLQLTDGHAFMLFTSYRALNECHQALRSLISQPILVQGQAPRSRLLETFRTTPKCVLLGTSAFWEGVDVPGRALSHVLIDKLPFDVPSDPLNEARMQRLQADGREPFEDYQLPRAAIAFRQGFGRLIRRKGDRGIVSVLDPRIVTRRYGRFFIDSLPPVGRTSSFEQVRRWWQDSDPDASA